MRRVGFVTVFLALATLACNMPTSRPTVDTTQATPTRTQSAQGLPLGRPAELSPEQIDRITRSAVQVIAAKEQGSRLEPLWTGSGTIISPTGEIVTNCHVACGAPVLVILLTTNPDLAPEPTYIAEITHYDEEIDLAILQITADKDGNSVSPTDLPYLEIGNSDDLILGDPIRIFGYPGVGGETITYTSGAVSGFESANVGGTSRRVIIKTDASIASGNSGGTAVDLYGNLIGIPTSVNPDVREGVTIGGIGVLRPVNLVTIVQDSAGSPPPAQGAELPPPQEPDNYEPNNEYSQATGPIPSGSAINAYISWEQDVDVFYIEPRTTHTISVKLTDIPSGTDYDIYLLDRSNVLAKSDSQSSEEFIRYTPSQADTYWIAVASYGGASTTSSYTLTIDFDGGQDAGSRDGTGIITITGQAVDANTGDPLSGGQVGVLANGLTCNQFFDAPNLDMSLVIALAETDNLGFFELNDIPDGADYAVYFVYNDSYACENGWLDVPQDAADTDLGVIKMSF